MLSLVLAGCSQQPATTAEHRELCTMTSNLARKIMEARQMGTPMQDVLAGEPSEHMQQIAIAAYEQPRYASDEYVKKAIDDFGNDAYLACIK